MCAAASRFSVLSGQSPREHLFAQTALRPAQSAVAQEKNH
jgi:hypothetical protein